MPAWPAITRVLADLDVVGDLHEVVDLGAAAHDGAAERRAVDGDVGAELHVVLEHDGAELGHLVMAAAALHVAEPVAADHAPLWTITRAPIGERSRTVTLGYRTESSPITTSSPTNTPG